MKMLIGVVLSIATFASISYSAQIGSTANRQCPIFCATGSAATSSVAVTAGVASTACVSNAARIDGYIMNTSTNYLKCSFNSSTTTGIDNGYYLIYPAGDAYGRDRLRFKNDGVTYTGGLWYYAVETGLSTKGAGSATFFEWK